MQNLCTFKLSSNVSIPLQRDEYSTLTSVTPITVISKEARRWGGMSSYLVLDW
jgi:hypothetical protein